MEVFEVSHPVAALPLETTDTHPHKTMAQYHSLSLKVAVEFLNEGVKILRENIKGRRYVIVPSSVVDWSVQSKDLIDRIMLTTEKSQEELDSPHPDWKLSKSLFRNQTYIGYVKYLDGQRIGLDCINLHELDFVKLCDIHQGCEGSQDAGVSDQGDVGASEEVLSEELKRKGDDKDARPPSKKSKQSMDIWRWVVEKGSGCVIQESKTDFLTEENCDAETEVTKTTFMLNEDTQDYIIKVIKLEVDLPTPKELARKVYHYLLRMELEERVKKVCCGCQDKVQSKDSHVDGCLNDQKMIVQRYARPCHLRVSAPRLVEACSVISSFFDRFQYVSYSTALVTLAEAIPADLLMGEKPKFEYEYVYLDGL